MDTDIRTSEDLPVTSAPGYRSYEADTAMSFLGLGTCLIIIVFACLCVLSFRYLYKYRKLLNLHDLCSHYWRCAWIREECCGYVISVSGSDTDTSSSAGEEGWEPPPYDIALGMKRVDSTTIMGEPPPIYSSLIRNPKCYVNLSLIDSTEGLCGSASDLADPYGSPRLSPGFPHFPDPLEDPSTYGTMPKSPDGIIITVPLTRGPCETCSACQCHGNVSLQTTHATGANPLMSGSTTEKQTDEQNNDLCTNAADIDLCTNAQDINLCTNAPEINLCTNAPDNTLLTNAPDNSKTSSAGDTTSQSVTGDNESNICCLQDTDQSGIRSVIAIDQSDDCSLRTQLPGEELPSYEEALESIKVNSIDL